jgi:DNA-binding transcriptional ArsR family regulator
MPRMFVGRGVPKIREFVMLVKPLLMEPRRSIIQILSEGVKSTGEIYEELKKRGIDLPRTTLYYHLSILEEQGIIEMSGYKEPERGSIPEKTWKLKVRRIGIDLVSGEIFKE